MVVQFKDYIVSGVATAGDLFNEQATIYLAAAKYSDSQLKAFSLQDVFPISE